MDTAGRSGFARRGLPGPAVAVLSASPVAQSDVRRWRFARALTLVEVLAALALLGGTVTGLLLAQARALQQGSDAEERRQAAELARDLIQQWQLAGVDVTVPDQGSFAAPPGWSWRRSVTGDVVAGKDELVQVRLEIVHTPAMAPARTVVHYAWLSPRPAGRDGAHGA